jgi:hypothetical protein
MKTKILVSVAKTVVFLIERGKTHSKIEHLNGKTIHEETRCVYGYWILSPKP